MELLTPTQTQDPTFNVITPQPFSLSAHSQEDKDKIRDECMDKVRIWEGDMNRFFQVYKEYAQSWRIRPVNDGARKQRGFSNSKSGETHRATETLATLFFRMLTASDSYFSCVAKGLDPLGQMATESDLYSAEQVLIEQFRKMKFKEELLTSLTSMSLFGTTIFELSWQRLLNPNGMNYFEGTKMKMRPLITTAFDTSCYDIAESDYIIPIDYLTKWKIRSLMNNEPENWDRQAIEEQLKEETYKSNSNSKYKTNVANNVRERRQRAGYRGEDNDKNELVNYLGKIDVENSLVAHFWESNGFEGDPKDYDFSVKILNGEPMVYFSVAPFGSWHTKYKSVHYKKFELEPLAYGTGSLGYRTQKDLDISLSRAQDTLLFAQYGMWKLGRYAGIKPNQLQIKPHHIIEMDDINQLDQLKTDLNAVQMAINFQGILREEIRTNTGATANLQAIITKATATESSLTQSEAMRSASVHAEIIGETFIRETLDQCHVNNLYFLDSPIWTSITGEEKPRLIDKNNLPSNIGFEIKITTDKDFRPERIQKILEALQMMTSIRNIVPQSINAVAPLFEEYFRAIGMNPRLLRQPKPAVDEMTEMLKQQMSGGGGAMNEVNAEIGKENAGGVGSISTPMGDIPTSPNVMMSSGDTTAI